MQTWATKLVTCHKARQIELAVAILVATMGATAAEERSPPDQYYGPHENNGPFVKPSRGLAQSRQDRNDFNRSGTRGRQGLGASPIHPEGAGNVSQ
jgi:hypothetical protein